LSQVIVQTNYHTQRATGTPRLHTSSTRAVEEVTNLLKLGARISTVTLSIAEWPRWCSYQICWAGVSSMGCDARSPTDQYESAGQSVTSINLAIYGWAE
jgi:hypothetical protein